MDSDSLSDFMSTMLANQLKLKTEILTKPLPVQLAVSGSHTKVNCSTTVQLQYQLINEQWHFDIMNLDGYNLILGTPFMFQHQVLIGFNPSQVVVKSAISLPLKGDQVTMLSSLAMDLMEVQLATLHDELQVGWHMGMAWVGKVQPTPVPAKPIPMVCFTHTCTVNPWVFDNTMGTCKPVWICCYFLIFS